MREALNKGYEVTVLKSLCLELDKEVQRIMMEMVFLKFARFMEAREELGGKVLEFGLKIRFDVGRGE